MTLCQIRRYFVQIDVQVTFSWVGTPLVIPPLVIIILYFSEMLTWQSQEFYLVSDMRSIVRWFQPQLSFITQLAQHSYWGDFLKPNINGIRIRVIFSKLNIIRNCVVAIFQVEYNLYLYCLKPITAVIFSESYTLVPLMSQKMLKISAKKVKAKITHGDMLCLKKNFHFLTLQVL